MENVRMWSRNGLALRACAGTPNICLATMMSTCAPPKTRRGYGASHITHMCEQLLRQSSPLRLLKRRIKTQDPATALETVPCHFEFVHCVHILYVQLDTRPVRRLGRPEIQVLMPTRLKVERVVTRV